MPTWDTIYLTIFIVHCFSMASCHSLTYHILLSQFDSLFNLVNNAATSHRSLCGHQTPIIILLRLYTAVLVSNHITVNLDALEPPRTLRWPCI